MTPVRGWQIGLGVVVGLALAWLALVVALLAARPRGAAGAARGGALAESLRLLPDALRLIGRLAADRTLPAGVRIRLGLLGAYLALPFDLIPDFVPVVGYADDALVVAWTLRAVTRRAGLAAVRRHWPGTDDGFAALVRLCRLDRPDRERSSWWVDSALLAGFVAVTVALANGALLGLDLGVRNVSDAHRSTGQYWTARGLNLLGQGTPLTALALGVALWLVWRRRSVRPVLPVIGAYLALGCTLAPLKALLARAAPHAHIAHPERLFSGGISYPSGHLANAVVWYSVLGLLLAGVLTPMWTMALRAAPPVIVFVATTYLGFHWLTDAVAGLLLGLLLERLLRRVPWDDLRLPLGGRLTAAGWARPGLAPEPDPRP